MRAEKLFKDELYLAKTPILNIRIYSRIYHFRLWAFASTGEYIYY